MRRVMRMRIRVRKEKSYLAIFMRMIINGLMQASDKKMVRRPINLTVSDEVRAALESRADTIGVSISRLVGALAKIYCGLPIEDTERPVEIGLKRVIGREQFLAFLAAVRAALPDYAEALPCRTKPEGDPEAWELPFGVGVLAFYAPTEANIGLLFAKASALKTEHRLARVLVVTTNGDTMPSGPRADLAAAEIVVMSIAELPAAVAKLAGRKPRKTSP